MCLLRYVIHRLTMKRNTAGWQCSFVVLVRNTLQYYISFSSDIALKMEAFLP